MGSYNFKLLNNKILEKQEGAATVRIKFHHLLIIQLKKKPEISFTKISC